MKTFKIEVEVANDRDDIQVNPGTSDVVQCISLLDKLDKCPTTYNDPYLLT